MRYGVTAHGPDHRAIIRASASNGIISDIPTTTPRRMDGTGPIVSAPGLGRTGVFDTFKGGGGEDGGNSLIGSQRL